MKRSTAAPSRHYQSFGILFISSRYTFRWMQKYLDETYGLHRITVLIGTQNTNTDSALHMNSKLIEKYSVCVHRNDADMAIYITSQPNTRTHDSRSSFIRKSELRAVQRRWCWSVRTPFRRFSSHSSLSRRLFLDLYLRKNSDLHSIDCPVAAFKIQVLWNGRSWICTSILYIFARFWNSFHTPDAVNYTRRLYTKHISMHAGVASLFEMPIYILFEWCGAPNARWKMNWIAGWAQFHCESEIRRYEIANGALKNCFIRCDKNNGISTEKRNIFVTLFRF